MKITALRLFNVKRFAGRGVAIENIGDGVNVLCAANEFGKSTSFEALHALFFQPYSSTAGDVRNLRPYSGGNPMVEADIATEMGQYRIAKQFYGGRSARVIELATGRLIAQADEAENFIAGLTRDGTAGPAGLLWVRQGLTGIEKRSRSEEDNEQQVRVSLLESVQGEVEAVTGGRRMAEIMTAVDAELGRMVTPTGRPKAGERFAAAIDLRDRLETEERRLAAEVTGLREALDRRAAAEKRLAELDRAEDRDARKKDIETAQTRFDEAKSQVDKLHVVETELKLARELCDNAARDLTSFRTALEKGRLLQERISEAERKRTEAVALRDDAASAVAKARHEADAAETVEQEKRALLARLDAALRAREAAERLVELERSLAEAEATRKAIEDAEAALALLRLPDSSVAELEALDVEIAKLRAVAEVGRASVTIVYETQAPAVSLEGEPMKDGEPRSYSGQAELAVPGVGTITLRSNQVHGSDDSLSKAEARRGTLLASMDVADHAAARRRQVETQSKESDLREGKGRLSLLAPDGLPKLREDVAMRQAMLGNQLELQEDPVKVRAAHSDAEGRRLAARQALREAEPTRASADTAFVAAETAVASLAGELVQVEAVLGPAEVRTQREHELADKLAGHEAQFPALEAEIARLQRDTVDLTSASASLQRVRSVQETAEKEIGSLRETIAGLAAEIRARSDDAVEEKWRETADALDAARNHAGAFEKEVMILQRLCLSLETARSHARDTYLKPVMAELQPLLGLLFDDVTIGFDEKTLLPQTITRSGQVEEVERLSGGMREQLSVLTRLAFARLLAKDGRSAPVILDDALVYSDDDRIEKMFDALHRQARDQQIIVFSCRQRAFQRLGGNALTITEWFPPGVTTAIGVVRSI